MLRGVTHPLAMGHKLLHEAQGRCMWGAADALGFITTAAGSLSGVAHPPWTPVRCMWGGVRIITVRVAHTPRCSGCYRIGRDLFM